MPPPRASGKSPRNGRSRPRRRSRLAAVWPTAQRRTRWYHGLRSAPLTLLALGACAAAATVALALNGLYQVVRKPSELFFPVSGTLNKVPAETWAAYEPIFRRYSTPVITPELLAALAQGEGSGNPVARTYWRWSFEARDPSQVYRPASSAVGMYQITDGTFAEARGYCIRDHKVVEDGPWDDPRSCWFNRLYTRVIPAHAVELTSAHLDRAVTGILARRRITRATLRQKQDLAILVHLCGAGAGQRFAAHGLRLPAGQRCGDHDARVYLGRVNAMKRVFAGFAAAGSP